MPTTSSSSTWVKRKTRREKDNTAHVQLCLSCAPKPTVSFQISGGELIEDLEGAKCQLVDFTSFQSHHTWFKGLRSEADLSYVCQELHKIIIFSINSSLWVSSGYVYAPETRLGISTTWIFDSEVQGEEDSRSVRGYCSQDTLVQLLLWQQTVSIAPDSWFAITVLVSDTGPLASSLAILTFYMSDEESDEHHNILNPTLNTPHLVPPGAYELSHLLAVLQQPHGAVTMKSKPRQDLAPLGALTCIYLL